MRRSTQEILTYGVGGYGSAISTGSALTGTFIALTAVEETVVDSLSGSDISGLSSLDGKTLAAGTTLFGTFTYVKPTSGTVIAYYA